jgi:hypothetical protein
MKKDLAKLGGKTLFFFFFFLFCQFVDEIEKCHVFMLLTTSCFPLPQINSGMNSCEFLSYHLESAPAFFFVASCALVAARLHL